MENNFSIKVFGVKERQAMFDNLINKLNLSQDDIFYDDRKNGGLCIYTAKKAWLSPINTNETHRVCLTEDVDVCKHFKDIVQQIIDTHPNAIIGLFSWDAYRYQKEVQNLDSPYFYNYIPSGPGIIIPTKYIQDCFDWIKKNYNDEIEDDVAIIKYCQAHNIDYIITIPGIIQHISEFSILNKGRKTNNINIWYDENVDTKAINWTNKNINKIYDCRRDIVYGFNKLYS